MPDCVPSIAEITAPVLTYPDFNCPFILDTDASGTGIGAVLSQQDKDGHERVIAYASRVLTKAVLWDKKGATGSSNIHTFPPIPTRTAIHTQH